MASAADHAGSGRVATNRKALHDYQVLERIEVGLELLGTEVKSVRDNGLTLIGGFARIENGQATLYGVKIAPYACGNQFNHEPERPRRLLLHGKEIARLGAHLAQKGLTLVPLNAFFRKGWLKLELGICRGRQEPDKRERLRRETSERELQRAVRRG